MTKIIEHDEIPIHELVGTISEIIAKFEELREARGDVYVTYSNDRDFGRSLDYSYELKEGKIDNFSFGGTPIAGRYFGIDMMIDGVAKIRKYIRGNQ